jgi:polysaccharide export outer membrane protein
VGPEDILDVQVWKNTDLSRVVPVRPDGMISLPLVNDIQAAGLTPEELRQQITQRLSEFVPSPEVSVIVREVHSVKVAVLGNVKMPGHYEVKSPSTVLELIARAQGLTEFADRGRIVVLRQNGSNTTRIPFNYRRVAQDSDEDNFYVRPGDIIVVP